MKEIKAAQSTLTRPAMAQERILILRVGQGHWRAGRQHCNPIASPNAATHDRNARPPPSGKDRQSAFTFARSRAAARFLDRHAGTLELQSLRNLLSRRPCPSTGDYLARPSNR